MTADNQSHDTEENAVTPPKSDTAVEQQSEPTKSEPAKNEPVKGPGKILQEVREQKGLSQRDVADRLRLRLQIIELLEADDYDSFSTPTFIKGYLRSYAKLLDVDQQALFAAYRAMGIKEPDTSTMQSFSRRVKHQENDNRLMLITYAVIIVVIGLVIWWWQDSDLSFEQLTSDVQNAVEESQVTPPDVNERDANVNNNLATTANSAEQGNNQRPLLESEVEAGDASTSLSANDPQAENSEADSLANSDTDSDVAPEANDVVASPAAEVTDAANDESTDAADTTAESTDDVATDTTDIEPEVVEPTAVQPEPEMPAEATNEAVASDLVFEFSEECWVKVDDAAGETQAVGIKAQGYRMPVPGTAPFSVTICKPEAVSITYQGEAVDLSGFRAARVARFTVPLGN